MFFLYLPALTVLHQPGEISQVCAETHHTLITIQSKQYTRELGEISVTHLEKAKSVCLTKQLNKQVASLQLYLGETL